MPYDVGSVNGYCFNNHPMVCSLSGYNRKETMYALHLIDMVIWAQVAILYGFYHTDSLGLTRPRLFYCCLLQGFAVAFGIP